MKDIRDILSEGLIGSRRRDVKTLDQIAGSWNDILIREVPGTWQWSRRSDIVKSLVEDMKNALGDKDVRDLRKGQGSDSERHLEASNEIILATTNGMSGTRIEYLTISWPAENIHISVYLNGTRAQGIFHRVDSLFDLYYMDWPGNKLNFRLGTSWAVAIGPGATSRKAFEEFVKSLSRNVNTVIASSQDMLSVM